MNNKCLYCGNDAIIQDEYQGIPLLVCAEGHRTAWIGDEKEENLKVA